MHFDRYSKVVLTIIAIALLVLVFKGNDQGLLSSAEAKTKATAPYYDVFFVKNIPAKDLREVAVLGDQKTFLVQTKDLVTIYQVQLVQPE